MRNSTLLVWATAWTNIAPATRIISRLTLMVGLLISLSSRAQTYSTVALTGFNADIIADGASLATSVNGDVDGGGYYFLNQSFTAFGTPTAYLPTSGFFNSAATPGLSFQLADATANNSLRLSSTLTSGTLNFVTPQIAGMVYVLATSGAAASTLDISVNFSDGTSQTFTGISVADWFQGTTNIAISGIGRTKASVNEAPSGSPRIYQLPLQLTGSNIFKQIVGITVTRVTGGFPQIMGVSLASSCTVPTAQPTGLILTSTSTSQISGSFSAASPAASQYIVVRYPAGSTPVVPSNGVNYTAGASLGNGTVIQSGTALTFSTAGLIPATAYDFYVYAINIGSCIGPVYATASPLTGTVITNSCASTSGIIPVGPTGTYPTLTAALTALGQGIGGPVILELQPTYSSASETYPLVLSLNPCFTATNTLTIRPASGASGLVISSSNAGPTIDFNSSKYVTIDGRPGGVGTTSQLSIINTNAGGVAVRFINDAQNNNLTYLDLQGQNTSNTSSALSGVVYFSTAAVTGNDNNSVTFSSIHGTATGTPAIGISASGSTTNDGAYNDNDVLSNNNIYDYFLATSASTGVKLDVGNNAWTITNNSLYQTTTRTYTTAATHRALWITPNTGSITTTASGFVITGNFIGGTAPLAGGTAYTMAGNIANVFNGMDLSLGSGTASSVQNNVVANINLTTSSTGNSFVGIGIANGNVNIGTVTGNVIGSATSTGNILVNVVTSSLGTVWGIRVGAGNNINVANNTVGGFTISNTGAISHNFIGIGTGGGNNINVTNNLVGSTTVANSIVINNSTSTTSESLTGISIANGIATSVTGNTVANLTNNYTGSTTAGTTRGIIVSGTIPSSIQNNIVRDIRSASVSTSTGPNAAIAGIVMSSTNASGCNVTGNTIHTLVSTSTSTTAAIQITGLVYSGASSVASLISRNFIHSFDATAANTNLTMTGIDFATAAAVVSNNMIRLGIRPDGTSLTTEVVIRGISSNSSTGLNSFYFNSIYIGGTAVGTTAKNSFAFTKTTTGGTYDIRNNIFVNVRSNASTGGKHYAMLFTTNMTGVTLNSNIYQYDGTGGVFANNGAADVAAYTSGWVASDIQSIAANPLFVNPTGTSATVNLHLQAGTPAEGTGIDIPSITDDFDGEVRASLTPVDIGADAGNYGSTGVDVGVTALLSPAAGSCYTATQTVAVQLRNFSTTAINFAVNNVTVTASASGAATYNSNIVLNTGTLAPGAVMTVTLPATINMTGVGTYTFNASTTVTGDQNATNNAMAATTRVVTAGASLSGTYNVGAGQAASGGFNTLTAAVAAYNTANCIGGNVTFLLTDPSYTTLETFPITINAVGSANATLTIKPAPGVTATISGANTGGILVLNGADYVTIDGSNNGSSSRDLTVSNTISSGSSAAIMLKSLGTGAGATNNVIRNLIVSAGSNVASYVGIQIGGNTAASSGDDNDNNTIENNLITKAYYGIYAFASVNGVNDNLIIRNNIIGSTTAASAIGFAGISLQQANNLLVSGNDVFGITSSGNSDAIAIGTGVINARFTRNKVHDLLNTGTFRTSGIALAGSSVTSNITIDNNFLYNINGNGTNGNTFGVAGIYISGGGGYNILFNSISLTGNRDAITGTTATSPSGAILITSTTTSANIVILNNILSNTHISSGAKSYAIFSASPIATFTQIDYNDYWVSGPQNFLGFLGSDQATLANMQAAFGGNTHSLNLQPTFVSPTDLHMDIAISSALDNKGTPAGGITTDIDGDVRSSTTPDIGADEFAVVTGIDFGARSLVLPAIKQCYGPTETVTVRIRNFSANVHNFAAIPVTVNASATGPNPTVFAPVVVNTGTLAPGDSLDVVITNTYNMTALGTYTFDASTAVAADVTPANNAMVSTTRTLSAVAAGTVSTTAGPYCFTGTPTITIAGSNGNIQWQQASSAAGPWTNVGTGTTSFSPAAPITATTFYQAVVSCNAGSLTTNTVQVVVNSPAVTASTPGSRCGPGTVTLTATASAGATLNWYAAATGGTALGTGTSFTTPIINANTTYYVAAETGTPVCASVRTPVLATVNAGPAFDITDNTTICNGAIKSLSVNTPAGNFNAYTWSPVGGLYTDAAATIVYAGTSATNVFIKNTTAGTYTYVVNAVNTTTGCTGIDSVKVTVLPGTVTISGSPTQICVSGTTTLSPTPATGYTGATFQWQSSPDGVTFTNVGGATSQNYTIPTLTTTTHYRLRIFDAAGNNCLQPTVQIVVNSPQVTATTPGLSCGTGTVTLGATGSTGSVLNWYTAASGGAPVGTGTSFITPSLSATTTYYVSATAGGAIQGIGATNPLQTGFSGVGTLNSFTTGMRFDVLNTSTSGTNLQSVDIFPTSPVGTPFEIAIIQGPSVTGPVVNSPSGQPLIYSGTTSVSGTIAAPLAQTVPLNFSIPGGFDYIMVFRTSYPNALRNSTATTTFPYAVPGELSITASTTAGTWNYFYNWRIGNGCESPRVAVTATVSPATAITTQPQGQAVCAGTNVTFNVVAVGANITYVWRKNGNPIPGATSATYTINGSTPADNGTYTVVVSGPCGNVTSANAVLSVSPSNAWLGAVSSDWNNAANWCGAVPTATSDVVIPSGTPFSPVINGVASVRNLTINAGATLTTSGGAQFNIYGNYANSGTLDAANGFLFFRGATPQTVGALTAANVIVNGAGGLTLTGNMNVTTLVLQAGNITLGNNNLTMTGSLSGTNSSHIVTNGTGTVTSLAIGAGPVIIPIGADATSYNPVMIANGQGRNYTVSVAVGVNPAITVNNRAINRTWTVNPSAAVTSDVSVTLQYNEAEGNAAFIGSAPVEVGLYTGTLWKIASPPNGIIPLGPVNGRQVTIATQSFGPMVVTSPGGISYPTAVPDVNTDVTGMVMMPNAVQSNTVLRVVARRTTKAQFCIVDAGGRVMMTFDKQLQAGTNDLPLNLSRLAGGMYFVSGSTDKGKAGVIRFIKL